MAQFMLTLSVTDLTTAGTVQLNDWTTGAVKGGYAPTRPQADADGNFPKTVTDPAVTILLRGGKTAIEATIKSLNRLFQQAREYQRRTVGAQVYIQFKLDYADTLYRSEVVDGGVEYDRTALDWMSAAGVLPVDVAWTRRFYWESAAETELPLTNGNGSSVTGGINVYNSSDGAGSSPNKKHNYVEIAAADVAGDIPAAVRLALLNSQNVADKDDTVWIAHNVNSNPSTLAHILEAESGTGGTTQADATCSNGNRKDLSVTTTESELLTWTLGTSLLSDCGGNFFTVLARLPLTNSGNINNTKFRLKLKDSTGVVWTGPQIRPDSVYSYAILPLGSMRLPPRPVGGNSTAMTLALWLQSVSGSFTVSLDFLELAPLDGWRLLQRVGDAVAFNDRWVDDMIGRYAYVDTGEGSNRRATVRALGAPPIRLMPNKLQRLYFLAHTNTAFVCEVDRLHSVRAFYRPRRLAI